MYENYIEELLNSDTVCGPIFKGCVAKNELPNLFNNPSCFILNTQPRNKNGEHWLAIYVDNNNHAYFFDSYGMPPKYYNLDTYMIKNSKSYEWNKARIQGKKPFCGYYCILFLLYISRNKLRLFFKKFTDNFINNDNFIYNNMIKNLK